MVGILALALAAAPVVQTSCPVKAAQPLVGKRFDDGSRRRAEKIAGKARVRWIMPGSAVTQDWSPSRLNLEVGEDGRILKAWCG